MKTKVQKFGRFLSSMIMPNIGALIAFGFLAAFFNPSGWTPNEDFAKIYSAMLTYLIPILIAYTGGKLVSGVRGGVTGAIACMGAIMSDLTITMLMAAMIMGPLGGWCIKMFDKLMDGHTPAGFEMLIDNFSIGIIGLLLALLGYIAVGPLMTIILNFLSAGVEILITAHLLPALAIFIEPAKVLFLNNAINHGIFTPLATAQAAETGKSIIFMLEPNPGPGLGVLLAYMFFCKDKNTRQSAPGAVIIHLFGGIHEIYFPYILMKPIIIIGPIVGNMAAIFWFSIFDCGLTGPASPGSIIAFMMMCPGDKMLMTFLGFLIATAISFVICIPFARKVEGESLDEATEQMKELKGTNDADADSAENGAAGKANADNKGAGTTNEKPNALFEDDKFSNFKDVRKIVFACDAGMGSSAMGATKFKKRLKAERPEITVIHSAVDVIPNDCDIAVVQKVLVERAESSAPQARIVTIKNFLGDENLDRLYDALVGGGTVAEAEGKNDAAGADAAGAGAAGASAAEPGVSATDLAADAEGDKPALKDILQADGVVLGAKATDKEDAINQAGDLLHKLGYVDENYKPAMQDREKIATTYMGMGVAIPHGTTEAKASVKKTGVVFLQFKDGVQFGEEKAYLVFGIAGVGDEHLDVLAKICTALEDEKIVEKLKTTDDPDWILKTLA